MRKGTVNEVRKWNPRLVHHRNIMLENSIRMSLQPSVLQCVDKALWILHKLAH